MLGRPSNDAVPCISGSSSFPSVGVTPASIHASGTVVFQTLLKQRERAPLDQRPALGVFNHEAGPGTSSASSSPSVYATAASETVIVQSLSNGAVVAASAPASATVTVQSMSQQGERLPADLCSMLSLSSNDAGTCRGTMMWEMQVIRLLLE